MPHYAINVLIKTDTELTPQAALDHLSRLGQVDIINVEERQYIDNIDITPFVLDLRLPEEKP